MEVEFLPCPTCGVVVAVDIPPCADGHSPDECPDRACTQCGTALVRDPMVLSPHEKLPVVASSVRRSAA
jgi:hypothetical protein